MNIINALSFGIGRKLPMVLQTEGAECGLACLAMLLGYHGVETDLATLRRRHPISLKGMTLNTLAQLAEQEQLGSRALRLELSELNSLRLPAILHWELNHFVVLKEVRSTHVVVHDPAFGERKVSIDEVSKKFTGVALETWPNAGFVQRSEKTALSLHQLIGQVAGFWPSLTQVLLLSLALEVFALLNPLFLQWIIDHVLVSKDTNLLTTLTLGFVLLLLLQQTVTLLRSWLLLVINTSIRVQWRSNVFSHLMKLPIDYFQRRHLGDVVSRAGAVDEIQKVLTSAFVEALFDGLLVVVSLLVMFLYSPILSWLAILAVLLYLTVRIVWYRPLYAATEETIARSANVASHFLETIRGVKAIKLFGRQSERRGAWQTLLVSETNASLTVQKLQIFYKLVSALLSGGFYMALMWFGTRQIMSGELSVGMLLAFLAYRTQFDSRLTQLISKGIDLMMLRLYAERLSDVVLTPSEPVSARAVNSQTQDAPPDIAIEGLGFRYAEHDPWVLDAITLNVAAGQSLAITGASGCGKTTLVNLLLGVYQPAAGVIRIGNIPLEQLGNDRWRQMVGSVMQDDSLFAGSLADNISFFDARPDLPWVEECAKLAAVHTDIQAMAMGYQTLVGDMGTVLSGGQKQRVLLARALYKRPCVLILDEATSHLDLKREALINASIAQLQITRIVIAHRPETIGSVQRVVEMDKGKIIFDGEPRAYFERLQLQRTVWMT